MDGGCHLKLYRVVPVTEPVTSMKDVELHNADCCIEDFHSSLVEEYIKLT